MVRLHPWPFILCPIHGPDVERHILVEPLDSFSCEADPFLGRDAGFRNSFLAESLTRAQ